MVDDALMLRYLDEHEIKLNEQFQVISKDVYNDYISIKHQEKTI